MCDAHQAYLATKRNPVLCAEYKINKNEYDLILRPRQVEVLPLKNLVWLCS
jgi:hypothetical protein